MDTLIALYLLTYLLTYVQHPCYRWLNASIYSTQGLKKDVSAVIPNLTLSAAHYTHIYPHSRGRERCLRQNSKYSLHVTTATCDLELWPPDPDGDHSCSIPGVHLCRWALKSVHSCSKYSVHNFLTDERTDRRTDEETSREHYASGKSRLAYTDKNSMFADPDGPRRRPFVLYPRVLWCWAHSVFSSFR